MIPFVLLLILMSIFQFGISEMTIEQINESGATVRAVCQMKFNTSTELIDGLKTGNFPDDRKLKCYVNCALEMMQSMRKGKLTYDAALNQINTLLPKEFRENYRNGLDACKESGKGIKDHCEAAYTILNCFFNNNPQLMFP